MVGGGRRGGAADETKLNTGNVFAALETLKKKKKGDKAKGGSSKGGKQGDEPTPQQQKELFWAPAPLNTKSWADVEDDDDDDYFATTAPPAPIWGNDHAAAKTAKEEEEDEVDAVHAALPEVYFLSLLRPLLFACAAHYVFILLEMNNCFCCTTYAC